MNRFQRTTFKILLVLAGITLVPAIAFADPTSDKPNTPMSTHGTISSAPSLCKSLYGLYETQEKTLIQWGEMKVTRPQALPARKIQDAFGKVWKAVRDARHLQLMGESAGSDLTNKLPGVEIRVADAGLKYANTTPGQKARAKALAELQRTGTKRQRALEQAKQAAASGNLENAEKQLEAYGMELHENIAFLTLKQREPYLRQLGNYLSPVDQALSRKRRAAYKQQAQRKISADLAKADQFAVEARRIASEISASGSATLGSPDTEGDALVALDYVAKQWADQSASVNRCAALYLAFNSTISNDYDGDGESSGDTESNPISQNAGRLYQAGVAAIADLVSATAQWTPAEKAGDTYSAILRKIAVLNRRCSGTDLQEKCLGPLGRLAAKAPGLANTVASYQQATSGLLYWRAKFANAQSKAMLESYQDASTRMGTQERIETTNKPEAMGRFTPSNRIIAPLSLSQPANWQVFETSTKLVGSKVSAKTLLRLSPTSQTAVSQYANNYFVNAVAPAPNRSTIKQLKVDLILGTDHDVLSFDAADAMTAAERNDYDFVGGVVGRVHLEAMTTRFATLPTAASCLVPIGRIPTPGPGAAANQICWRLDIAPTWAGAKYFVTRTDAR